MGALPPVIDGRLIRNGKPFNAPSIADRKHALQLSLRDLDADLAGINPSLSLTVTLREKRERIWRELEALETERVAQH